MTLKNKIIFGTTGFLVASGVIALTIVLATSDDESQSKAKVKTKLDGPKLASNSFEVIGTQTLGVVNLKSDVILAKEVELKYFVGPDAPTNDNTYTINKPATLKNGDIVYVKPFIKKASISSYVFKAKANPIKFVVSGLPLAKINSSSLIKDSFVISGNQTQGKVSKKPNVTLPKQVEIKYFRGEKPPKNDKAYKLDMPTNLSNGDKVHIKFFIKSKYIATYKFADDFTNSITIPIIDFPKIEVDSSLLVKGSFVISGRQGTGTMKLKDDVALPSEVEAKYYKGTTQPINEGDYQTSFLLDLSNGEKIYIKFFIKSGFALTHKLPLDGFENPIQFVVRGLDKNEVDATSLVSSSFQATGVQGKGTMKLKDDVTLPSEIEAKYYKGTNSPGNEGYYQTRFPSMLSNGDKVYIKFFIKSRFIAYNKLPTNFTNPVLFKVSNLIVNNGKNVFQCSYGNIWAMGNRTPLQVLEKEGDGFASSWTSNTSSGLLNGSKITNGYGGVIFEDSHGNIWAMGNGTPLQVLEKEGDGFASSWISDRTQDGLLKGSKITNGYGGVIFEDSKGNIWAMGAETPLQVLEKEGDGFASSWISDRTQDGLLKGSKITNGASGVIFEDSHGNIWAMGSGTPLQVLEKEGDGFASSWISDRTQAGLLNDSKITNGYGGVIFEDSKGNIWAMGADTPLQVLEKEGSGFASSWISDRTQAGLLNDSKITNGYGGVIFEDSKGNIWAMGNGTPLQVLEKEGSGFASSWISDRTQDGLLKGSKMTNGYGGVIFEDSKGNIWAMEYEKPLQVLEKEGDGFASSWISDRTQDGLLKGSKITNGYGGVIFEDSKGNIWAMGKGTPLQVLEKEGSGFATSWTSY